MSDGINAPPGVARDWDWELTVAEAQKGYVKGVFARAGLQKGVVSVEAAKGVGRRRSREG